MDLTDSEARRSTCKFIGTVVLKFPLMHSPSYSQRSENSRLGSLDLLFSDLLLAEMLSSQHEIAQPTGCWTIKSNSGVGLTREKEKKGRIDPWPSPGKATQYS